MEYPEWTKWWNNEG